MEILDPDLWNDDGTPKKPTEQYMRRLEEAQDMEAVMEGLQEMREAELAEAAEKYKQDLPAGIGDVVHFWDEMGQICRAAIVMEIEGHVATLRVHIPNKPFEDWECNHDEGKTVAGLPSWHWAETS